MTELLRITVKLVECNSVIFSNDGKQIISGWSDGKIRAFFPETGKLMWIIEDAHKLGVTSLELSHDDSLLVSGGQKGDIRIWTIT